MTFFLRSLQFSFYLLVLSTFIPGNHNLTGLAITIYSLRETAVFQNISVSGISSPKNSDALTDIFLFFPPRRAEGWFMRYDCFEIIPTCADSKQLCGKIYPWEVLTKYVLNAQSNH